MSGNDGMWADLSSQNERVVQAGEPAASSTNITSSTASARWAELASQGERLIDDSDPLFRLASSRHAAPGMRKVASAA
ncbi:MAG TPA: hypothetical protein VME44_17840 [Streptosporangiaceae bacterium]|jgi:hypothetical protein|nr:hypothetical protein [Streptosporangiaceae bacterium]